MPKTKKIRKKEEEEQSKWVTRNWTFVINNWTDADRVGLIYAEESTSYIVYSEEVGKEGTPHIQGYMVMKKPSKLSALKKLLPRAHFEKRIAPTHRQAADYCRHTGPVYGPGGPKDKGPAVNLVEKGEYIEEENAGAKGGEIEKARWEDARQAAKERRFDEIPGDIYLRCYSAIHKEATRVQQKIPNLETMDFWWFYGPAGSGKSSTAREENENIYVKNQDKWWDGYDNQDCVLIEDVDFDRPKELSGWIKIWCDHYAFMAETKGGSMFIRPKKIIFTSQYRIDQIWLERGLQDAINRRLKTREFNIVKVVVYLDCLKAR